MTHELYQKAIKFAGEKHKDQKVPGSNSNYVVHISNVAMEILTAYLAEQNFDIDLAIQLALLHDTIEDTDTDFDELNAAFGLRVAQGVQALTKNDQLPSKEEKMTDSLNRIQALEKEVGMVKLADRITNLQPPPNHWSTDKIRRYVEEARIIGNMLGHTNAYLSTRLNHEIAKYETYAE